MPKISRSIQHRFCNLFESVTENVKEMSSDHANLFRFDKGSKTLGIMSPFDFQLPLRVSGEIVCAVTSHSHSKLYNSKTDYGFKISRFCEWRWSRSSEISNESPQSPHYYFVFWSAFSVGRLDSCQSIRFLLLLKHFADSGTGANRLIAMLAPSGKLWKGDVMLN